MNQNGTALITGGARRIGRAIALRLAELGFNIALHYNASRGDAERVANEIECAGGHCELFACDLSHGDAPLQLIDGVTDVFSDLSILVNNASIF
ncbi:MAG: SDR family NAD(P)-dependent oxidoreductase, partial [Planctomycetota bacterium]